MKKKEESWSQEILPVPRTKDEARRFYDRIARLYDCLFGRFELRYALMALEELAIKEGETVLEIGFGPGHCLERIAQLVGEKGRAYGVDISPAMLGVTEKRLKRAKLGHRVELYCGDAVSLPYTDNTFNAVFMSFTLELFDTPEIPALLKEIQRVLKPAGRLGIVSMSRENGRSLMLRLYEWLHTRWPKYIDCRPIYLERSLTAAGYKTKHKKKVRMMRLPGEIVIAIKQG